jgi:16S rRNA C967 or C1407 C5-methylase (RsmB/RsmF family)
VFLPPSDDHLVRFEAFYQAQLNLDDQDWEAFMDALKRPLPACFRINTQYLFADELKKQLQQYAGTSQIVDGVEVCDCCEVISFPS